MAAASAVVGEALAVLFALAMLVAPGGILLAGRNRKNSTPLAPIRPPVPRAGTGHPVAPSGGSLAWPLLAGVLLAVAAVFILAILARRRRDRDRVRTPGPGRAACHPIILRQSDDALARRP